MYKHWQKEVERVKLATNLPIFLHSCDEQEWAYIRTQCERDGGEIICQTSDQGRVWYVFIERDQWHFSARSLLSFLFTRRKREPLIQDHAAEWLQSILLGNDVPVPAGLDEAWNWKEARACFVLQRLRAEHPCELPMWQHLLQTFFSEKQKLLLYSLSPSYLLLLLPVSVLMESGKVEDDEHAFWLEWASGLHDMLSTETLESVRVIVTHPVDRAPQVAEALRCAIRLTQVLERYHPRQLVSTTWKYPLERWALSLGDSVAKTLQRSFQTIVREVLLTREQSETLEVFFSHNLNISETARSLYLHRNTLLYRLDKIKEQTGLDPRHLEDAVLLRLSQLFR